MSKKNLDPELEPQKNDTAPQLQLQVQLYRDLLPDLNQSSSESLYLNPL
jgi:hypothetical protein